MCPPLNPRLHFWYPGFHTFPEWWCRSYYVGQLGWSHLRLQLKDAGWSGEWIEAPRGKQENDSLVIMTTVGFKRGVGILAQQTPLRTWLAFRWAGCDFLKPELPWPSEVTQSMFSLAEIATYNGMEIIRKRRWTQWLFVCWLGTCWKFCCIYSLDIIFDSFERSEQWLSRPSWLGTAKIFLLQNSEF